MSRELRDLELKRLIAGGSKRMGRTLGKRIREMEKHGETRGEIGKNVAARMGRAQSYLAGRKRGGYRAGENWMTSMPNTRGQGRGKYR